MAMGIPVITNDGVGDMAGIVRKYNGGYVVQGFEEKNYLAVTEQIISGHAFDPAEISAGALEFYSLDRAVEKYAKMYAAILKQ